MLHFSPFQSDTIRMSRFVYAGRGVLIVVCVLCLLIAGCKNRRNGEGGFGSLFGSRNTEVSVQRPPMPPEDLYGTPAGPVVASGATEDVAGTTTPILAPVAGTTVVPTSNDPKSVTLGGLTRSGPPASSYSSTASYSNTPSSPNMSSYSNGAVSTPSSGSPRDSGGGEGSGIAGGYGGRTTTDTIWEVGEKTEPGNASTNRPLLPPVPAGSMGTTYVSNGSSSGSTTMETNSTNGTTQPALPLTSGGYGTTSGTITGATSGSMTNRNNTSNSTSNNTSGTYGNTAGTSGGTTGGAGSAPGYSMSKVPADTGNATSVADTGSTVNMANTASAPNAGNAGNIDELPDLSGGQKTGNTEDESVLSVPDALMDARGTDEFDVIAGAKTIRVVLRANRIFEPQSAEWVAGGRMYVEAIMEKIFDAFPDRKMIISGHMAEAIENTVNTSNTTVAGNTTNTEEAEDPTRTLSATRASEVAQMATDVFKKPASQFEVKGLGDSEPMYSTGTSEGTQANERIEITILPPEENATL